MSSPLVSMLVGCSVGALTQVFIHRVFMWRPRSEPFDPGLCEELPEHAWSHASGDFGFYFRCPKCGAHVRVKQPPYCPERGGHFHMKCEGRLARYHCGYEWVMKTYDKS